MRLATNAAGILILLVALAAIVVVMLATGWADDKAPPGSRGRVPVTYTGANHAR